MKKILFICIATLLASMNTNAQLRDSALNPNTYKVDADRLFQKAKNQNTTAWILLGAGAGMAITGLSIMAGEAAEEATNGFVTILSLGLYSAPEPKHSAAGPILSIAGTGAMLGSIPLFIASGKNKRNANLILKNEIVYFTPRVIMEQVLSLGVKINL